MLNHLSYEPNQDPDIITELPEEILTRILSFLPLADANRTCILSSKWKNLWALLPNLRFVMPVFSPNELANDQLSNKVNKFHDQVDRILAIRSQMPIQTLYLHCTKPCDYSRVYEWLSIANRGQVQKLDLRFAPGKPGSTFCWDSFKVCRTLAELSLEGEFMSHHIKETSLLNSEALYVSNTDMFFPSLRKINLVSVDSCSGYESLQNLISGCPVLEELTLERHVSIDKYQTISVASASLKTLRILFKEVDFDSCVFVIDAPKLENLYVEDYMSAEYVFKQPPLSIVEGYINTIYVSIARVATCLQTVKVLTLTCSTMNGLNSALNSVHGLNMPVFPNLVKLVIAFQYSYYWNLMSLFLNNMPNLEHITFSEGIPPFSPNWNPTEEPPACLRFKMKEIIILTRKTITQEELVFIEYLLKNSSNLETFTINAHSVNPTTRERLLNFPCGSRSGRVEFV